MASSCFSLSRVAAAAVLLCTAAAHAQTTTATMSPVTVTGTGDPVIGIGGWGDVPASRAPFQASIVSREQIRDLGVQRLADVVRIDASVSDAYNTEGYWDYLTVRGFVIDNRYNYRRDGLPINAETSIPLDNKERIEILKGTSGLQAGTSAPGGLVNFVVKRPVDAPIRDAVLAWHQSGSLLASVDIGQRFGVDNAFGLRVNAAAEHLDPRIRDTQGKRHLFAVAGDWRISPDSLLEAEIENSHRSQPSVPGYSLLGANVPAAPSPPLNLNNQPWTLPVVLDGTTASLRYTQRLNAEWRATLHAATQRLVSDDRIAFPFGCSAEGNFDRYCSDGTFDLYDYRSDNERRRSNAVELALHGSLRTGSVAQSVSAGVLRSDFRSRFERQAYNFVGTGNVQGTAVTPADPTLTADSSNRDESSTELFVRDALELRQGTTAWLGLRHTRLARSSVDTSGNVGASYTQGITIPGVALSHEYAGGQVVYASWGQGVESYVTPRLPGYGAQSGQALPALKSRQLEVGIKGRFDDGTWGAAAFDIDRPVPTDTGSAYFIDGTERHRGIELNGAWQAAHWTLQGSAQILRARREGGEDPTLNGKRRTNVPEATLKLQARHDLAAWPGLSLLANVVAESNRVVLPDNSLRIPGYARIDASVRCVQATSIGAFTWRAGVDNVLDRRAWRESPYQFGHAYLFPLPQRALRVSVEAAL
jgi:iron complex outermembrane receptor protein